MKNSKPPKKISAAEFERKFDNGEDIIPYLDLKNAKVNAPLHRINIDIPLEILKRVDREAGRIGVTRTAIIKLWISERIDRLAS